MTLTFRHAAGFGKRMEYWIIGQMLKEGLDVYVPLVDDDAVNDVMVIQVSGINLFPGAGSSSEG